MPHHYLTEQAEGGGGGVLPQTSRYNKRMKALQLDGGLVFDANYDEASLGAPKGRKPVPGPEPITKNPPRAFIRPL